MLKNGTAKKRDARTFESIETSYPRYVRQQNAIGHYVGNVNLLNILHGNKMRRGGSSRRVDRPPRGSHRRMCHAVGTTTR